MNIHEYQAKELQTLRRKIEYSFNPFDTHTRKSGTVVHAIHQLERAQLKEFDNQRKDSAFVIRNIRRLEDRIDELNVPAQPPVHHTQKAFIDALYSVATTAPSNSEHILHNQGQAQASPKPSFGHKRYFGPN